MSQSPPQASQLEFFAIPSPCIGVCESGPRGFCKGCFRSRDERLYWLKLDDATKRKIVVACQRRKLAAQRRKLNASNEPSGSEAPIQESLFQDAKDS